MEINKQFLSPYFAIEVISYLNLIFPIYSFSWISYKNIQCLHLIIIEEDENKISYITGSGNSCENVFILLKPSFMFCWVLCLPNYK